jgi:hypothetical protein
MRLYIGTIARNIESSLLNFISFVSEITRRLPDTHVLLYENNSTDATRALLPLLQTASPYVQIQSEDFTNAELLASCKAQTWDNKPCRMEVIARARNKLLDMIRAAGCTDGDYVLMIDCDIAKPFESQDIDAICERVRNFPHDADALFANGLNANGVTYYDMYALRHTGAPFGPEIVGEDFWKTLPRIAVRERTPIYSGFGGMALYRGYCVKDNAYSALPTSALHAFTTECMKRHGYVQPKFETHYRGALIGIHLFGDDVYYHNNSGYNYPVVCEHSTFHATLAMRGQGRFIIDPAMRYYSNH